MLKPSTQLTQKGKPVQQSNEKSWQNSDNEMDRHIDMVTINSFTVNSIITVIMTKLETSNRQKKNSYKY